MKKLLSVLLLVVSSLALAANEGYLVDSNNNIVKSGTGMCWHTGYWTPANAVSGCDTTNTVSFTPTTSKVTLNADMIFAFDKANLTDEGKNILNRIVVNTKTLKGLEAITIVGYTDRIGTDAYNIKLSERRAQTVRNYIVSQGVSDDHISVEGRGKAKPITGNSCKGNAATKKLIACLQPDRRAVIEIIGIK
jgi:OOP family OmpA-OmpF porin